MKTYTYKKQGDGSDSWTCIETDDEGNVITKYMVYQDPYAPVQSPTRVLDFFASATPEEIAEIKRILGL